jgi:hypothetical protein
LHPASNDRLPGLMTATWLYTVCEQERAGEAGTKVAAETAETVK